MSSARERGERVGSRRSAAVIRAFPERVGFVWGALTNVATTSISFWVAPHAELAHLMIIHLLGAVLISTRFGMAVSTFTAVTGALAFDYFCIPPVFAFAMPDPRNVVSFAGMLLVALLVCWLNQGLRRQRALARASEERTQVLCQLSLELTQVANTGELLERAERHLRELFGDKAMLRLTGVAGSGAPGVQTQPIQDQTRVYGYVRIEQDEPMSAERRLLLAASADRIAEALKRLALGEAARRAEVDAEVERNRNALLSAVSHDMKTPLASIMAASTSLLNKASQQAADARELLETIVQESERMNGMITNLLSVTRLESGEIALERQIEALDDLVFTALSRFSGRLSERDVTLDIPADLPVLSVDAVLIDHVLVNLLENALRYTPTASPIEIRGSTQQGEVWVEISDHGPGIPATERERVFDKFYRGQGARQNDGGTGLGLTICRAVVRAHGGSIEISSSAGGGATVRFNLPVADAPTFASPIIERRADA